MSDKIMLSKGVIIRTAGQFLWNREPVRIRKCSREENDTLLSLIEYMTDSRRER
jgi:hypothetical protein